MGNSFSIYYLFGREPFLHLLDLSKRDPATTPFNTVRSAMNRRGSGSRGPRVSLVEVCEIVMKTES